MRTDWERLREKMLRPEINKIIAKETYTAQDACDLKVLLKNLEMSYTNEMFEEQDDGYEEGASGAHRRSYNRNNSYGPIRNSHMVDTGYDSGRGDVHYDSSASGHTENEMFKAQLQSMLMSAKTEESRRALKEAIDNLH